MEQMVVQDIRSLRLYQLIAAPLIAIVQADAQAAKTSLEFIEDVGFLKEKVGETEVAIPEKLRMVSFTYRKIDENGKLAEFTTQVPVLSLVPIPLVSVKDAKIEFSVKITDVITEKTETSMTSPSAKREYYQGWLQPYRTEFRGTIASKMKEQIEGKHNIDVCISIEKSDIPLGLSKIFHMMDQAIYDEKREGKG